jgi:putative transposase
VIYVRGRPPRTGLPRPTGPARPRVPFRGRRSGARTRDARFSEVPRELPIGTVPALWTHVTAPRQVLPGTTYLVTRRCAQRQFLLKPGSLVNQLFLYVLAVAAARYGILVHAICVVSNHYHLVVTDPDARLPAFHQFLDALVARALNALHGRWEVFWAPNSYSAVALATPEDVLEKCAYALANPVSAGLVRHGHEWPGLWSAPEQIGGSPLVVRRPEHFFDPEGSMPESATLQLEPPPGFASTEEFQKALSAATAAKEEDARAHVRGRFLGATGVLAQKPTARPRPGEPRRGLNPRLACRDKWKRIECIRRLRDFLDAYRAAWARWCADDPDVRFPAGTYQVRVLHGAACVGFG